MTLNVIRPDGVSEKSPVPVNVWSRVEIYLDSRVADVHPSLRWRACESSAMKLCFRSTTLFTPFTQTEGGAVC